MQPPTAPVTDAFWAGASKAIEASWIHMTLVIAVVIAASIISSRISKRAQMRRREQRRQDIAAGIRRALNK